jgi:hypothetical protein
VAAGFDVRDTERGGKHSPFYYAPKQKCALPDDIQYVYVHVFMSVV